MLSAGSVTDASKTSSSAGDGSITPQKKEPANNDEPKVHLAQIEHRAVVLSKVLVALTLAGAAIALGSITYIGISKEEENNFRTKFGDYTTELIVKAQENSETIFGIMKSLGVTATSLVLYKNDTVWPNYSVPHVAQRMAIARKLSKSTFIALSPIVELDQRSKWEGYAFSNQGWVNEGLAAQGEESDLGRIPFFIHSRTDDGLIPRSTTGPFSPVWQMSPAPRDKSIINFNLFENDFIKSLAKFVDTHRHPALSKLLDMTEVFGTSIPGLGKKPESLLLQPIFEDFSKDAKIVAHFAAVLEWENYFKNILVKGAEGVVVVVEHTCGEVFSFEINGPNVADLGTGDHHDRRYDDMVRTTPFAAFKEAGNHDEDEDEDGEACDYFLHIYPSDKLRNSYTTNNAVLCTTVVVLIFFFTSLVFVFYDKMMERKKDKMTNTANRTNQIVSSLFPQNVRDQIFSKEAAGNCGGKGDTWGGKRDPKSFLKERAHGENKNFAFGDSKPCADLFPYTTVMFADIIGFTAWSSVREPHHVFIFLETIFRGFDQIAKQRGVFKVETVGSIYVAVTGLPEPNKEHAVVMAKFARDCLVEAQDAVRKLEMTLGPDTADLEIRVGLHSGPVIAGVLRGDRARFQLFGDTMNTAARMQSTGQRNKIQLSGETANLLIEASKESWVKPREDVIFAKGKGALQTFWLTPEEGSRSEDVASSPKGRDAAITLARGILESEEEARKATMAAASVKVQRLIDWNYELLLQLLKKIVAHRRITKNKPARPLFFARIQTLEMELGQGNTALDEVCEIITLPNFDAKAADKEIDPETLDLGVKLTSQLRDFVSVIASLYRDNPFHCFEHASHVTMSVTKLLSRIAAPDALEKHGEVDLASALHDHTYGITSDPLTQFSVVMAALIHDVDHRGVPNFVLCKEEPNLAAVYREKSVAEQNSVDLAWNVLMDPSFSDLRCCIYEDEAEMKRFRQILVNSVMATDIFDKELGLIRKKRWNTAFHATAGEGSEAEIINRKATIVIEHLMQASDVAHTMQHWHIYQKWNARLFQEMYSAFLCGRSNKDPSEDWYRGEIGFFDHYIIPLAKKLKECGVFGVSSDEYLSYATNNRREWEAKGQATVVALVEKCQSKHLEASGQASVPIEYPVAKRLH